ncbi:MAG: response regulator [bacterium]
MKPQEQELLEALRAEYASEALERLQAITTDLLELEKAASPDQQTPIVERVYRNTHNLKGEARAVNYTDIESLCQAMETVFASFKKNGVKCDQSAFDTLHASVDLIRRIMSTSGTLDPEPLSVMIKRLSGSVSGAPASSPPPATRDSLPEIHAGSEETVRMPLSRLENLMLGLEEMLAVKLTTHHRVETLREAFLAVEQLSREGGRINLAMSDPAVRSRVPPRLAEWMSRTQDNVATLEAMLSALSSKSEQDDNTVSRLVDLILGESKKLLMLPSNTLLERLPKLVRDLSRDQGKEVDIIIRGGDIEIEKHILQELKDAVIHLVRNSVDHGIETAEVRQQRKKPVRGTILVEVSPVDAGKVELVVRDDGGGVDVEAVKAIAVKRGILSKQDVARLSREEAIDLIFRSAISTSPIVTSISGRGLGMAIVKERVEKLGGLLFVETKAHEGSMFRMVFPLTLATFRGAFVEVGAQCFIIPSTKVERVGRVRRDQVTTGENQAVILLEGRTTPFVWLSDVLEIQVPDKAPVDSLLAYVLLREESGRRVMFGVDQVLNEEEVLVRRLLKPLSRVRNVAGATILASGKVVPVLNVADLMASAAHPVVRQPFRQGSEAVIPAALKRVLLVEDSIISRMLFKSILESAGYVVKTSVDGEEAWNAMQVGEYDAVVSDIEMPRMDGFELMARIRADSRVAGKPVILVTGRSSPEDRLRGMEAGANAYIVKSSFDQSDLLEALKKVL